MKKYIIILTILLSSIVFTSCASFYEKYKPLYQAKPIKESIKGEQ